MQRAQAARAGPRMRTRERGCGGRAAGPPSLPACAWASGPPSLRACAWASGPRGLPFCEEQRLRACVSTTPHT